MLNLNAMFGSCESIFDQQPKYTSTPDVSATELQMMEMEISTDLAKVEVDNIKAATTMSQLDQVFSMYNHVKKFGIDRTFLSLFNTNGQLNNMLGMKFPSCESVDSEGYPNSNMSKAFIVAMEDNKEGIIAKIIKGIKWVWEKIKHFCSVVWNKIKSWIDLGNKKISKRLDSVFSSRSKNKRKGVVKVLTDKKVIGTAIVTIAAISAIIMGYKALKKPEQVKEARLLLQNKTEELAEQAKKIKTENKEVNSADDLKADARDEKDLLQKVNKAASDEDRVSKHAENVAKEEIKINASDIDMSAGKGMDREKAIAVLRCGLEIGKDVLKAETTKANTISKIMAALNTVAISQEEFCKILEHTSLPKDQKAKLAEGYSKISEHAKGLNMDNDDDFMKHINKVNEVTTAKDFPKFF